MTRKQEHVEAADEADDPKGSPWAFLIAFLIVLLVIVGITWYTTYQKTKDRQENQYNGFDFAQAAGGLWITRIQVGQQPYDVPFYFHPRDVEDIHVDSSATSPVLRGAPRQIYISIDPDAGAQVVVAGVEISRLTGSKYNLLNIETHGALSRPAEGKVDIPVITCQNATPDVVVLQFVQGSSNAIARSSNPSCIILQYTDANESVRVADRYAYMLLKIM